MSAFVISSDPINILYGIGKYYVDGLTTLVSNQHKTKPSQDSVPEISYQIGMDMLTKYVGDPLSSLQKLQNRGSDFVLKTTLQLQNKLKFEVLYTITDTLGHGVPPSVVSPCGKYATIIDGQIYNYKGSEEDLRSDRLAIVKAYEEYGDNFLHHLRGEWSLVFFDLEKNIIFYSTDAFGTKPLYAAKNLKGDLSFSSHRSALRSLGIEQGNIFRIKPNTCVKVDLGSQQVFTSAVHTFCLKQHKSSYDDWSHMFLQANKKRFINTGDSYVVLPLSSGHDSGGISCALAQLGYPPNLLQYTLIGDEDFLICDARDKFSKDHAKKTTPIGGVHFPCVPPAMEHRIANEMLYNNKYEAFYYGKDYSEKYEVGFEDPASVGLAFILEHAKLMSKNYKILASGHDGGFRGFGGLSMGTGTPNPEKFPDDLPSIFPWNNFYFGSNSSYLSTNESIGGGNGFEGRYPLLDVDVVQEFLWLTPKLKNSEYKAPLSNFLDEHNYPRGKGDSKKYKKGFNPCRGGYHSAIVKQGNYQKMFLPTNQDSIKKVNKNETESEKKTS